MLLGVCLLAPADFLQQYRNTKLVEVRAFVLMTTIVIATAADATTTSKLFEVCARVPPRVRAPVRREPRPRPPDEKPRA